MMLNRSFYVKFAKSKPAVFDLSRKVSRLLGFQDNLYKIISKYASYKEEITFIQIGSNDGISNDPIREFVVGSPRWRGCFVEPLPHLFKKLKQNYNYLSRKNLNFFNFALSEDGKNIKLFRVKSRFHYEFPNFIDQIASFDREHVLKHICNSQNPEEKIEEVDVSSSTFCELVNISGYQEVDLVHIDVEGYEFYLIPFILNEDKFKPDVVIFESIHMKDSERVIIDNLFTTKRFKVIDIGADTIAISKDFNADFIDFVENKFYKKS